MGTSIAAKKLRAEFDTLFYGHFWSIKYLIRDIIVYCILVSILQVVRIECSKSLFRLTIITFMGRFHSHVFINSAYI